MKAKGFENAEYFQKHNYRDPGGYVVRSYVMPKIRFLENNGCFQKKRLSILDVGSGNGTFSHYLKEYSDTVVALDYSRELLRSNEARLKTIASGYEMPFKNDSFDIVFEANLLHHLDRPDCVIREMKRCCRQHLVFIEPNRYNPLMFLFSLAVRPERGTLISYRKRWEDTLRGLGIEVLAGEVSGMISQQNTPAFMVPFLKLFDFDFFLGEYITLVCGKG